MSKLWILETLLTIFEKSFSKNSFNISRWKRWVHPVQCTHDQLLGLTVGPEAPHVTHTRQPGSRRRWGLRWSDGHYHTPLDDPHPMGYTREVLEQGSTVVGVHGGTGTRRSAGASHRNAQRGARELRGMMASTKSGPEGTEEGWGGASHGEPSQAAMAPPQRKTATRGSPRCERGTMQAHGLAKAEAELLADAIAKWRCVWGVRRRRTERRCVVARASARLAAAVESKCASAEGSRGQRRCRRRQCVSGGGHSGHARGVAGMQPPCGGHALPRSPALRASEQEKEARGLGWAEVEAGRARARSAGSGATTR
jgi:hypothetical protein